MRIALAVEYCGTAYCGWQTQKHCRSVQAVVESALSVIANQSIEVVCSGRTDSGVHGIGQIVHFDTDVIRPNNAWVMGVNNHLPKDVSIRWAANVSDVFHARYSAKERHYRYVILNRTMRSGLYAKRVANVHKILDESAMHRAAQALVGEHDFTSFRAAGCQAKHPRRRMISVNVSRHNDFVFIDIVGNAFLHNMVRIICGSLIKVGMGEKSVDWMGELLHARDRTLGGMTLVPDGLYFIGPVYPEEFSIPRFEKPFLFDF